jgi:hypothetical protein
LDLKDYEEGKPFEGRGNDLDKFMYSLDDNSLVVLHGESGVGKSSFLQVGLRTVMEKYQFVPFFCSNWGGREEIQKIRSEGFEHYIESIFLGQFNEENRRWLTDEMGKDPKYGLARTLCDFEGIPVLILDQFEEFIRHSTIREVDLFSDWLSYINRNFSLKIVVSLRSEYDYKLKDIMAKLRACSFDTFRLFPITDKNAIERIINNSGALGTPDKVGQDRDSAGELATEGDVANVLFKTFYNSEKLMDSSWLLSLQAVLYALYWTANKRFENTRTIITREHLLHLALYCFDDFFDRAINSQGSLDEFEDFSWWLSLSSVRQAIEKSPNALQVKTVRDERDGLRESIAHDIDGFFDMVIDSQDSFDEMATKLTSFAEHISGAGFSATIDQKLQHCALAAKDIPDISVGTVEPMVREHLRRITQPLKSDDYKRSVELNKLFRDSYGKEIALLSRTPDGSDEAVQKWQDILKTIWDDALREMEDVDAPSAKQRASSLLLSAGQETVLGAMGEALPKEAAQLTGIDRVPWLEDPYDVSSGAMFACDPRSVLIEQIKGFVFAALWLKETKICLVTGKESPTVRFAHDGLGRALTAWSRNNNPDVDPSIDIASFTAMLGERRVWGRFNQGDLSKTFDVFCSDNGKTTHLVNLRWRLSEFVGAVFRNTIFTNCDFSSSKFHDCCFEGVVFVNCLLDGAVFDHCTILGEVDTDDVTGSFSEEGIQDMRENGLPSFYVPADEKTMEPLYYYRGIHKDSAASMLLYSLTSGVAAIPSQQIDPNAGTVRSQTGGMLLLGGRVSSLMIRDCKFMASDAGSATKNPHSLAMAFVAGSSVDFVEQNTLSLYIFECAIRGLTVSRPVGIGAHNNAHGCGEDAFAVHIDSSKLINPWFGDKLKGFVEFAFCLVHGLTSVSPQEDFKVQMLNETDQNPARNNNERPGLHIDELPQLRDIDLKVDYRSTAAKDELERREQTPARNS